MTNVGDCVYCNEDTGTGRIKSSHIVCRKFHEGVDPVKIVTDMYGATMVPGQFEQELRRLFLRVAIKGASIIICEKI